MDKQIELGCMNTLKVNRFSEPGLYLIAEDEEEVLLPNIYITDEMEVNDEIDVFIYTDSEDRLVATTLTPHGYVDDFVSLEVMDISRFGAFCDWGLPKDLLVPKNQQKTTFNIGDKKVLQIINDERTDRLIGTEKFMLKETNKDLRQNHEVNIIIHEKTPLGFKVIVNNLYKGLIYHNEIFENISIGDKKKAYVKSIREDGKIDISLQKVGAKKEDENNKKVIQILQDNGGELEFTYKSEAKDIKNVFGLSKKAFKATLTKLIENNEITLEKTMIKINS